MEHLLHFVWKYKLYPSEVLRTTEGWMVEVVDPGLHNSDAGPDFMGAKLKIDGVLWVGNVEIHTQASDWYKHGHDRNKAYDSVILHVVTVADRTVTRTNGEPIPQVQLECSDEIRMHYRELCEAEQYPACCSFLSSLSSFQVHSWLSALQTERLEQKAAAIRQRLEGCNQQWEDAFFMTLARNYGFGLNGEVFEQWARLLPFRAVDKHRDQLFQVEAFFLGIAGLLEESFLKKEQEDEYVLQLRKEFRYLQRKFEWKKEMEPSVWRFLRLRPDNFPTVRLAQLAYVYHRADKLFSRVLEAETLEALRMLLQTGTSAYWETHFLLGRPAARKMKTMGQRSLDLLIINTVVPFLYAYGCHKSDERYRVRAGQFLEALQAEDNHIIRFWQKAGLKVQSAADSQALIQLQKEYCDRRMCLHCRFGYEYLKRNARRKK